MSRTNSKAQSPAVKSPPIYSPIGRSPGNVSVSIRPAGGRPVTTTGSPMTGILSPSSNTVTQRDIRKTEAHEPTHLAQVNISPRPTSDKPTRRSRVASPSLTCRRRPKRYRIKKQEAGCCWKCNDNYSGICDSGAACGGCNSFGCCDRNRVIYRRPSNETCSSWSSAIQWQKGATKKRVGCC